MGPETETTAPAEWDARNLERAQGYLSRAPKPNPRIKAVVRGVAGNLSGFNLDHDARMPLLEQWAGEAYGRDELENVSRFADLDECEQMRIVDDEADHRSAEESNDIQNWALGTDTPLSERIRRQTEIDEGIRLWNEFQHGEHLAPAVIRKSQLQIVRIGDITLKCDRLGLVKGLLDEGAMSVLFGESWTGKTLVALALAFHIAAGLTWWDARTVRRAFVVYIATEGSYGVHNRVVALGKRYTGVKDASFALVPNPVDLSGRGADVQPLLDLIAPLGRPGLIVIDTLSRALSGGDENSPVDMGDFIKNVDRLRSATGAHVMVIHHSGKDQARGARGHSALRAATDTELEVVYDQKTGERKILVRKQRDIDCLSPIGFAIEPVAIGQDPDGTPVTAPVAVPRNLRAAVEFTRPKGVTGRALTVLEDLTVGLPAVPVGSWNDEFARVCYEGKPSKVAAQAFRRAQKELQAAGIITVENGKAVLASKASNSFNEAI